MNLPIIPKVPVLRNGAKTIAATAMGDHWLVLASWREDSEFVTWMVDLHGDAYWGRYFVSIISATRDYAERGGE